MMQKYSGAGNTFIMVNNLDDHISDKRRHVLELISGEGEGMDGVIFLEKSGIADFKMNYFNRDGTGDALCGNGLRCTARFAADNKHTGSERISIEAVSGIYDAQLLDDGKVKVKFPPPRRLKTNFKLKVHFEGWWEMLNCSYADVGSPHIVVFIDEIERPEISSIEEVNVLEWGRNIRMHKDLMPEGANVNFVKVEDAGKGKLLIRSYERGVEGETLACGTGAMSSAIVFYALRGSANPVTLKTRSGEELIVELELDGNKLVAVQMTGNATRIK